MSPPCHLSVPFSSPLPSPLLQAEVLQADQELSLGRLQKQEAALRDSLAKMGALSEGLASDKVELTRLLLQVLWDAPEDWRDTLVKAQILRHGSMQSQQWDANPSARQR